VVLAPIAVAARADMRTMEGIMMDDVIDVIGVEVIQEKVKVWIRKRRGCSKVTTRTSKPRS
jgi:hypothetical protein